MLDHLYASNTFYLYLLLNDTVSKESYQTIGKVYSINGHGQGNSLFSPDGKQYAYSNANDGVYLFDFDRETGLLSNPRYALTNNTSQKGLIFGLAFSRIVDIYTLAVAIICIKSIHIRVI